MCVGKKIIIYRFYILLYVYAYILIFMTFYGGVGLRSQCSPVRHV